MGPIVVDTKQSEQRLFLSDIGESFDPERDLALGPWCFIDREDTYSEWEKIPFFDAFEPGEELENTVRNVDALLRNRLTLLAEHLNHRHGVNYSFAYWWTLAARWMNHLICTSWRRWVHLKKYIEYRGDDPLKVIVSGDPRMVDWDFRDSADFSRGLHSERFDCWLWSECARQLAPVTWTLEARLDEDNTAKSFVADPPTRTNALRSMLRARLGRLPFSDVPGAPAASIGFFSCLLQVLPRRRNAVFRGKPLETPPSSFPQAFLNLLDFLIERTMPISLGADFTKREAAAASLKYSPGRLFVTGAATMNDVANFQTAHAIESGERIVRIQHGSDYGTMTYINIESSGEYLNDAFLTWGWISQNGHPGNFVPIPAPGLSRLANRHRQKTNALILVGTKMTLRTRRIDHIPQPTRVVAYRREKLSFVRALDEPARRSLIYRDYKRSKSNLSDAPFIQANIEGLKLCEGELDDAILGCRLLILDHPGTLLNVALAANIPTVCYWDQQAWPLASEAAPYFNALKKVGIIFPDAAQAANHVNRNFADPQAWWSSSVVQRARTNWTHQYARTSKIWWWHWVQALTKL